MLMLGNLAALVGCVLMVAIGFIKKKERILTAQCVQFAFMGLGNLALGAMAGFISNAVSIVRNLVFSRIEATLWVKIGFVAVQTVLTLLAGGGALIEWLPVVAVVVYTWFLDVKSAVTFKIVILFCQVLWLVYDWYYRNYVAFAFDIMTLVSTCIGILMIRREKA